MEDFISNPQCMKRNIAFIKYIIEECDMVLIVYLEDDLNDMNALS